MQATLTDYVVQGSKVFWPAAGITATSKSCSCGCHGCQHQSTAARLLQAPGSTHWSDESLQALKEFLIDTCYDLDAAQAKFLSLPYSVVRSMSRCMDDDSLDRLYELVFQCDRCHTWYDVDDESQDVSGICLNCVR